MEDGGGLVQMGSGLLEKSVASQQAQPKRNPTTILILNKRVFYTCTLISQKNRENMAKLIL